MSRKLPPFCCSKSPSVQGPSRTWNPPKWPSAGRMPTACWNLSLGARCQQMVEKGWWFRELTSWWPVDLWQTFGKLLEEMKHHETILNRSLSSSNNGWFEPVYPDVGWITKNTCAQVKSEHADVLFKTVFNQERQIESNRQLYNYIYIYI